GTPVDLLHPLTPGNELKLEAGTRCTVAWFSDGHLERVSGPATFRVERAGLTGGAVEKVPASVALVGLTPRPAGGARTATTTRGGSPPPRLLPVELSRPARVPAGLGAFRLLDSPYEVQLFDSNGNLVRSETLGSARESWAIPALPAEASYRVVFLYEDGTEMGSRSFTLEPGSAEHLGSALAGPEDDPTPWIARARFLEEGGFAEAALRDVLEALSRRPSPALLNWAADLYEELGCEAEARVFRSLAR
ncbi:MAG: hypothetical protein AB1758_36760, partial [Candidatus Eremiobacterota bacterium]